MSVLDKLTDVQLVPSNNQELQSKETQIEISLPGISGEVAIFKSEQRAISLIRKEDGDEIVKKLLSVLITDVFDFYGKPVSTQAIKVIYNLVITEYSFMKPADLELCFNRGMGSKYGKVDYFHAGVITAWLDEYEHQRGIAAEKLSELKASQYKENNRVKSDTEKMWNDLPEEKRKMLEDLAGKMGFKSKHKFETLEQYFYYIGADLESNDEALEGFVLRNIDQLKEKWKTDYEGGLMPHDSVYFTLDQYYDYRAKQELTKINL